MKTAKQLVREQRFTRLKRLRVSHGIGLAQVAQQIEVDQSHLSLLESGLRQPSIAVAKRLARFYAVSIEELGL